LQASKAFGDEAFPPLADGVAVTAQFGGDVLVGGVAGLCCPQNDAATKGQGLGGGTGTHQRFQLVAQLLGQGDGRTEGARHGWPPGEQDSEVVNLSTSVQ
jgi:hypothetical protein